MAELILSQDLTAGRLRELLEYFPATGIFRWRVSTNRRIKVGAIAGTIDGHGYWSIRIDGKRYLAHRLAWLYYYGVWPSDQIDHIDRDRTNNRISNLREATGSENHRNMGKPHNNTSGHVGVAWNKARQKWRAYICHQYEQINLGYFTDIEDAIAARKAGELKYWGALRAE